MNISTKIGSPFRSFWLALLLTTFSISFSSGSTFSLQATIGGSNAAFPTGSYGFLVADTAGDGFQFLGDTSLLLGARSAAENSLLGADDLIFAINLVLGDLGASQNGFDLDLRSFDTIAVNPNWGAGDAFAIVWLQSGSSAAGDSFGFYRSDSFNSGNGSNAAFNTPGTTAIDQSLFNLAVGVPGGTTSISNYTANNGTIAAVPEPSVILLIAFAPILVKLFRVFRTRVA